MIKIIFFVVSLGSIIVLWLHAQPEESYGSLKSTTSDAASNSERDEHLISRITTLEDKLLAEVKIRHDLERRLTELEKQLSDKQKIEQTSDADASVKGLPGDADVSTRLKDDTLLEDLRISRTTIKQIQQRFDKSKMELVSLRDRAAREGWIDTDRYNNELIGHFDPSGSIRDEFGDDAYDSYLYAVGKPNRVQIKRVYDNAEASSAGIQTGDVLLRYGSERLFSMRDLRLASMGGETGQPVLVELLHEGSRVFVTVPQGPIGVELEAVNLRPD